MDLQQQLTIIGLKSVTSIIPIISVVAASEPHIYIQYANKCHTSEATTWNDVPYWMPKIKLDYHMILIILMNNKRKNMIHNIILQIMATTTTETSNYHHHNLIISWIMIKLLLHLLRLCARRYYTSISITSFTQSWNISAYIAADMINLLYLLPHHLKRQILTQEW